MAKNNIINYTTSVPAHKSIADLQQMLVQGGARKIMQDYDGQGHIVALSFTLDFDGREVAFRLPSDWRPVLEILKEMRKKNSRLSTSLATDTHAINVSWRIIKDWVEAQLALIQIRMVTMPQVFLPYAITKDGQTVYEYMATNSNLLLGSGGEHEA